MALYAHLQHSDSILPKQLGSLLMAAPVSTITAANKDKTGKNPTLTSRRRVDNLVW